jgi:hypothetical protein
MPALAADPHAILMECTAAKDTLESSSGAWWVLIRTGVIVVLVIPVADPLPDIATHVPYPQSTLPTIKFRDLRCLAIRTVVVGTVNIRRLAPGVILTPLAEGSTLPFGLGRQALADPLSEGVGVFP